MRHGALNQLHVGMKRAEVESILGTPSVVYKGNTVRPEPSLFEPSPLRGDVAKDDDVEWYLIGYMHNFSDWEYLLVVRYDRRALLETAYTALF